MSFRGYGRKRVCPDRRYYPGIFLVGLKKTAKNPRHNRSPGRTKRFEICDYLFDL